MFQNSDQWSPYLSAFSHVINTVSSTIQGICLVRLSSLLLAIIVKAQSLEKKKAECKIVTPFIGFKFCFFDNRCHTYLVIVDRCFGAIKSTLSFFMLRVLECPRFHSYVQITFGRQWHVLITQSAAGVHSTKNEKTQRVLSADCN